MASRRLSLSLVKETSDWATEPKLLRGFDLGLPAGLAFAVIYGLAAEPLGLTWGLAAVGFIGGILMGGAVSAGAWSGRVHITVVRLRLIAVLIAIGAWVVGLFLAYVLSQALYQQATTGLLERLSFGGFSDYFAGQFDFVRLSHAGALAAAAFMAWRGTR